MFTRILMFFDIRKTDCYIFRAIPYNGIYLIYVKARNSRVWQKCVEIRSSLDGPYKTNYYCGSLEQARQLLSLWADKPQEYEEFYKKQMSKLHDKKIITYKEDINKTKMHEALE